MFEALSNPLRFKTHWLGYGILHIVVETLQRLKIVHLSVLYVFLIAAGARFLEFLETLPQLAVRML